MSNEAGFTFQTIQDNCSYAEPMIGSVPAGSESAQAARGIVIGAALGLPLWVCIIASIYSVI